ncbi:MAG: DoxX family protein [Flavobacteriales bacterium]|nr:DoxX family protein [Flavobacteriales bacterium]
MKILAYLSRLLVGSLFIVSGLIKANDPLGFSYKLEEYFMEFGMDFLIPATLVIAIFICVIEVVLGAAALFAIKIKPVSWLLLVMIVFFTFLTFASWVFDIVRDCGCFGDALKLTPYQSFMKDVVLLVFVLIIFLTRKHIQRETPKQNVISLLMATVLVAVFCLGILNNTWAFPIWFTLVMMAVLWGLNMALGEQKADRPILIVSTILSLVFTLYCLWHLPVKDFRAYAVGKNIPEGMVVPEGAAQDVYETILMYKNKNTGEVKEFTIQNYPWQDTANWAHAETINRLISEGYNPPIYDFTITSDDGDITEEVLANPGYYFVVVAYDLDYADMGCQEKLNALINAAEKENVTALGLTASSGKINDFRHEVQAMYPYYITDGKTLKTIIRSNPGLLLIKEGTILAKWHYNDIPEWPEVKKTLIKK